MPSTASSTGHGCSTTTTSRPASPNSHPEGDPFEHYGGNPPGSWPTLYVNEDMPTVREQVRHLFLGGGVEPDGLDDDAPILFAAARLPRRQQVADVFSYAGVAAVGLPATYPLDTEGELVGLETTRQVDTQVHDVGLRGVWCRSAGLVGRELAWFPAVRATVRALWRDAKLYWSWRYARTLDEVR